ncbi:type II toxin-antitoxin system Phd/YefM family antitoxin [Desulfitobacterium sp. AusDCA]|uniref:type II toxin-antitoxin system Phd/YefM family antitoxin n=1 Tax=Desulfitobacterium sp. AusDCA TaxID=3240383 RepID=UPI003DA7247B
MLIKSSSALRNDYDNLVKLSHEHQEPIYITRNGEGEMVFMPIAAYERREAELKLLEILLTAERNRLAGAPTYSTDDLRSELKEIYDGEV